MRIGIDISQIVYGTGVSEYTKNLVAKMIGLDDENEYMLFGGSLRRLNELKKWGGGLRASGKYFRLPPTVTDLVWNRLHILDFERLVGRVDVYHSSDWAQAPSKAWKVTTVHDLAPIKYPKWSHPKTVAVHKRRLHWVRHEVDRIIVPSEATKNDLLELGFDEMKIRVIYEAVEEGYGKVSKEVVEKIRRKYRLGKGYVLMVGTGARKNLKNIIRGFELSRVSGEQLVIAGNRPKNAEEVRGVKYLGYVSDEELVALYAGAEALVYVTLYEGFGLPILQAMACGCPVVTSNVSSMSEIAGKAAVLVSPDDPDDIASGVKKVLKNRELYIKKGKENLKRFSWEQAARETVGVYKEAGTS